MSDAFLLLFMADGVAPPRGWLRLREGAVVARAGAGAIPSPAGDVENERIVLVVPGEDVVIHWIELPALAPEFPGGFVFFPRVMLIRFLVQLPTTPTY